MEGAWEPRVGRRRARAQHVLGAHGPHFGLLREFRRHDVVRVGVQGLVFARELLGVDHLMGTDPAVMLRSKILPSDEVEGAVLLPGPCLANDPFNLVFVRGYYVRSKVVQGLSRKFRGRGRAIPFEVFYVVH